MESNRNARVLFVDDDESLCRLAQAALTRRGHQVEFFTSGDRALAHLRNHPADVVVTDLAMEPMDGIELCRRTGDIHPHVPVVVLTGHGSMKTAVDAIRAGATDFVLKPVDMDALTHVIDRALGHAALEEEVRRLREATERADAIEELGGESEAMVTLRDMVARVAPAESTVLLCGETGTGKEVVARALHKHSQRTDGSFVAINCAAMPPELLESELFGHTKGAFTDARSDRRGLFEQADGGTLFLDEIGELPIALQPKLLRAIQERRIRKVGSDEEIPIDVRIIAATNRDLAEEVEEGRFREDLYYRINVVTIEVPPLRTRREDIIPLAEHFLRRFAIRNDKRVIGIAGPAASKLKAYEWRGNVRELENCMERAVALTRSDEVQLEDLPDQVREYRPSSLVLGAQDPQEFTPWREVELRYIERVIKACEGNKSEAARILGVDRRTLYRKLDRADHPE